MELLTLSPNSFNNNAFDYSMDLFANSGMNTISIATASSDSTHPSYMHIGEPGSATGSYCYKDIPVISGYGYRITLDHKVNQGQVGLRVIALGPNSVVYNDADIATGAWWKCNETSIITVPASSGTLRCELVKSGNVTLSAYIDNFAVNCNVIKKDPNTTNYQRQPEIVARTHQALSGKRIKDILAQHFAFSLAWSNMGDINLNALLDMTRCAEVLYFDDGDVPMTTERQEINTNELDNYYGITSPSGTNKAYVSLSANQPSLIGDFEDSEFATGSYTAIGTDDAVPLTTTETGAGSGNYIYHKFNLAVSIATADIQTLRIKLAGHGNDASPNNTDGFILYIWDGLKWVIVDSYYSASKGYINWETSDPALAQSLVNSGYIRLLQQSLVPKTASYDNSLSIYYVETEINEGRSSQIHLKNRIKTIDHVWNLTQATVLAENTGYQIGADKRSINIVSPVNGDMIEVKYNHWFEVSIDSLPETWVAKDGEARLARLQMRTLNSIGSVFSKQS